MRSRSRATPSPATSTLLAQHYLAAFADAPVQRQLGYHENHLERLDGWRIVRSEQRVSCSEGNAEIFTNAAGAFAQKEVG